jgi:histone H3/H4
MRDTPRDDLRQLSRALAVHSTRVPSSPRTGESKRRVSRAASFIEQEGSPALEPPRMSLPRGQMADDDDSFHEAPPRLSVPLDEYEVEGSRRQWRRDRESFGNIRLSDFHDAVADIIDETENEDDDLDGMSVDDEMSHLGPGDNETTRNLRALMEADRRDSADDVDLRESFGGNTDGEPTFQFRIADRSRLSNIFQADTDPRVDEEVDEELFMVDQQQQDDIASQASSDYDEAVGQQLEAEQSMAIPNSSPAPEPTVEATRPLPASTVPKKLHRSRFGIEYPSLQPAVVKKLASTFSKSYGGNGKINKETLDAFMESSDWFFEQVSEDLAAYADHARRKRIEESDVITLMKRYFESLSD